MGRQRTRIGPAAHVLEVGCGFGLETLRLARLASPGGLVAGCDLIPRAEARRCAEAARVNIAFEQARVKALPYPDQSFEIVWSERLLVYIPEVRRVLCPGGHVASIEPDISTSTLNLKNRWPVRRVMGHGADTDVVPGWLPGQLRGILEAVGFDHIQLATRVVVLAPDLAASYFAQCGHSAAGDGLISESELHDWNSGIEVLLRDGKLFATVGYFLFTARA